jgi:16S rRNA (guanine527-N7)-methyltransferase
MGCQREVTGGQASLAELRRGLESLGVALPEDNLAAFERYYELIAERGAVMNLTSIIDYEGVQRRHFLESIAVGAALRDAGLLKGTERVIDVGAGAGFPGIPLRLAWPGLRLTLLEATEKKAAFMQEVVDALDLSGVSIVTARAEDAARKADLRERFDIVIARAVAPLSVLAELTLPFARVSGYLAAVKGSRLPAELAAARVAIARCGGRQPSVLDLPADAAPKHLKVAVIRKASRTPPELPRRAGLPASSPLH